MKQVSQSSQIIFFVTELGSLCEVQLGDGVECSLIEQGWIGCTQGDCESSGRQDKQYHYSASLLGALGFQMSEVLMCCQHAVGAGQGHAVNAGDNHAVGATDRKVVMTCACDENYNSGVQ